MWQNYSMQSNFKNFMVAKKQLILHTADQKLLLEGTEPSIINVVGSNKQQHVNGDEDRSMVGYRSCQPICLPVEPLHTPFYDSKKLKMAGRGRKNQSANHRPVILALECPRIEESSSRRRSSQPQARVPRSHFASSASQFVPLVVTIPTGEDIGETIRAFLEEHKHIQPISEGFSVKGLIIGAVGDVFSPEINIEGSTIVFEGIQAISTLSGSYTIPKDGLVHLESLNLGFQWNDHFINSSVVGPLIAGCVVQATVAYVRLDDGEDQR